MTDSSQLGHGTEEAGALFSPEPACMADGRISLVVGNCGGGRCAPLACESFNHLSACQMGPGGRVKVFFTAIFPFFLFYTMHGGLRLVLFVWGFPRALFGTDGNDH